MKVYKFTVLAYDFDDLPAASLIDAIEDSKAAHRGHYEVISEETRDVDCSPYHPIMATNKAKRLAAFNDLFGPPVDSVSVNKQRLAELVSAEDKLNALECGGVDNWTWYGESLAEYTEVSPDELVITDGVWAG